MFDAADPASRLLGVVSAFISSVRPHASCLVLIDNINDLDDAQDSHEQAGNVFDLCRVISAWCSNRSSTSPRCAFVLGSTSSRVHASVAKLCEVVVELGLPNHDARAALARHCVEQHVAAFGSPVDEALIAACAVTTKGFSIGQIVRCFRLAVILLQHGEPSAPVPTIAEALTTAAAVIIDSMSAAWASACVSFHTYTTTASTSSDWTLFSGYPAIKARLQQLVAWPLLHPERLAAMGVRALPLPLPSPCVAFYVSVCV